MNYIGEKIKELRRKNGMTQEKMAEFLSVSYQTVSKWECGISNPDVYMIAPIARLFGVSTDELLGVQNGDARRAEFDAALERDPYFDLRKNYALACEAVREFPGELRYLAWLADIEGIIVLDREFREELCGDDVMFMTKKAVAHYRTVIENTDDTDLRNRAIKGIAWNYGNLGRPDEVKKYADMVPEAPLTRDDILSAGLRAPGKELFALRQRMMYKALEQLVEQLNALYLEAAQDSGYRAAAMDAEEAIIKTIVSHGNGLRFCRELQRIYMHRALFSMRNGRAEEALEELKTAKAYSTRTEALEPSQVYRYTAPLLEGYEYTHPQDADDFAEYFKEWLALPDFDPIRERESFAELLG